MDIQETSRSVKPPARKKRGRKTKKTTEEIIAAIRKTDGRLTYAAQLLGIAYSTMMVYVKQEKVAAAIKEVQENELDFAEHQLKKNVARGDQRAIEFLLKTKGKPRGYVERKEVQLGIEKIKELSDEALEALINGATDS